MKFYAIAPLTAAALVSMTSLAIAQQRATAPSATTVRPVSSPAPSKPQSAIALRPAGHTPHVPATTGAGSLRAPSPVVAPKRMPEIRQGVAPPSVAQQRADADAALKAQKPTLGCVVGAGAGAARAGAPGAVVGCAAGAAGLTKGKVLTRGWLNPPSAY
jgi:hypothetical protein